ncbi:helix-turn-helix domain-containing protein [Cerasicoccus arenae]|uniref:HTH iclR-type domain-containing protein n=1 Tax=Cerasicoccus arenae TaxID=424488 RepID=A0A8J3DEQ0_9BACT|nr:helix-turn-helix domain-containing protein [Cerasicoccus arenae]MBK1857062.1 helix-turn-helix domain-containing protein [Cerasicoccus arenae]GHB92144.1 hypothetical protein GCM10007047_03960 [Cerasicoccus arenae]
MSVKADHSSDAKIDPAPALTRGLALLAILGRDGQSSLEALVRKTGWPKSSVWRYLQALESLGAVHQDDGSKLWEARQALRSVASLESLALEEARRILPVWAKEVKCCVELYRVGVASLVLIDRAEPEDEIVSIRARIGFQRDLEELEATVLIYFAFQNMVLPEANTWVWDEGRKRKVDPSAAAMRINEARTFNWAQDNDFNEFGIRRFACPILDGDQLVGVIAIAQRQTPRAERDKLLLIETIRTNLNP